MHTASHAVKPFFVAALITGLVLALLVATGTFDSGSTRRAPGSTATALSESAYNEIAAAFRNWDKTVDSYFAGKSSIENLRTATSVASDVARSGKASGVCGGALRAYAAAIESYDENLRSSVPTNGLATALGDGERFVDVCKP